MTAWPAATLTAIVEADDLKISPLREDGVTFGTPTWIWCVAVAGELFVRGYHGATSRWYVAALARPDGQIHAAGEVFDVTFVTAPADLADAIDAAYERKYAKSPYLAPMIASGPRLACLRIVLRRH